jgi:hypothetical protein
MKYFVQLKDDVVFAYHSSSTEVDIPGDNIIEVDENGEALLNKKYVNGSFVDAPVIKYAKLDSNNTVISMGETVFSSEVPSDAKLADDSVKILSVWNGTSFDTPGSVASVSTIDYGNLKVTTSEEIPAMTLDEYQQTLIPEEPELPPIES